MIKIKCHICENDIELPDKVKEGERVTCPSCFAQTAVFKHKGKVILACAFCKDEDFDPTNCGKCERRRELKKIYEEGVL